MSVSERLIVTMSHAVELLRADIAKMRNEVECLEHDLETALGMAGMACLCDRDVHLTGEVYARCPVHAKAIWRTELAQRLTRVPDPASEAPQ